MPSMCVKLRALGSTRPRTVYYWTLVLGQVAAALASTTKRQPLFGSGGSCSIHRLAW